MPLTPEVSQSIVENLERIYAIGIGLAIREAVRSFSDKDGGTSRTSGHRINWSAGLECFAFAWVAICFFHGMNRYFETVYLRDHVLDGLAQQRRLMIDFVVFLVESSIIYVSALKLAEPSLHFYKTLSFLFILDSAWSGWGMVQFQNPIAKRFLILNLGGLAAYGILLLIHRLRPQSETAIRWLLCITTVARIYIDYRVNWQDFYFG